MCAFLPTTILRHRKENLKKCSLRGLKNVEGLQFLTYLVDPLPKLEGEVILTMDAPPPLSFEDRDRGLFLIDGTWKYAAVMYRQLTCNSHHLHNNLSHQFSDASKKLSRKGLKTFPSKPSWRLEKTDCVAFHRAGEKCRLTGSYVERSIPKGFRTSYPRKQTNCSDPERGLASVEALFIAYHILGYETGGLLDHYYWKEEFLRLNAPLLKNNTTSKRSF